VLICVNKSASTHAAITKAKSFCVNVLRMEDWHLSAAFSGGQNGEARFRSGSWTELSTGSPVLSEALVNFDCRLVRRISHGSHTIALGQVEQVRIGQNGSPLLYWESRYGVAASFESNPNQCRARNDKS
jgi:flavin reductase